MRAFLIIDMQQGMADRIQSGRLPVNPDAPDRIDAATVHRVTLSILAADFAELTTAADLVGP